MLKHCFIILAATLIAIAAPFAVAQSPNDGPPPGANDHKLRATAAGITVRPIPRSTPRN